jgi:hypothetical protein
VEAGDEQRRREAPEKHRVILPWAECRIIEG